MVLSKENPNIRKALVCLLSLWMHDNSWTHYLYHIEKEE